MGLLDSASSRVDPDASAIALKPASRPGPADHAVAPSSEATTRRIELIAGRILDIVVACVTLAILSPLLFLIAAVVRATSPGPALFRQERIGRDLRRFPLYKFRTMRTDASDEPHRAYVQALISSTSGSEDAPEDNLYKLTVDHRITAVGRYLRSWSLDEIPQLINVLRGEMSLVGPRPVIPYEAELYPEAYRRRFAVKPGLTGLWQVSGRNERTYHEMIAFDVQYAEQQSLWLDLKILARTVPAVLKRRGVA